MQLFLKMLSGMTDSVDPDQTAPAEAVWSGSALSAHGNLSETLVIIIIIFFINMQVQRQHPHQWVSFQVHVIAACMADLTPDLKVCLSWGSIAESFHSLQSLCQMLPRHLGPPRPTFSINLMSKAVLTAPLECTTCPCQPQWLSWMCRPTGDQEVAGSTPAKVGNILSWRLIMKYFLRSFSPFRWFKNGSCQFLAKECAQYWLTA